MISSVISLAACNTDEEPSLDNNTNQNPTKTNNKKTNNKNNMMVRTGQVVCGKNFEGSEVKCSANQYCADSVLNRCEIGCLSDDNCTQAQVCGKEDNQNVGTCQTGATNPCDGVTCNAGETCRSGKCEKVGQDLCANVQCSATKTCKAGKCEPKNVDPCLNVQCSATETCKAGKCEPKATTACTPNLTAQDGCSNDELCIFNADGKGICRAFPACDAQGACDIGTEGSVCSSKAVQGKSPQCLSGFCLTNAECPTSLKCVKSDSEPLGECLPGLIDDFCVDKDDCANDLVCDRDVNAEEFGSCQSAGCTNDAGCNGEFCVIPTNATTGTCSNGRATSACYEEADCIEALTCDLFVPGEPGICVQGF